MKHKKLFATLLSCAMLFSTCVFSAQAADNVVDIKLSDSKITVDGSAVSTNPTDAVYVGAEIIYYHDGTDSTYGEGTASEMHSAEEAEAHTVVTITQPGTYRLTGSLSAGQIAIDLGKDAEEDPTAVVTIILDNVDVTCTVAPALIFYNVYECCEADEETASATVDTSAAGANVIIAAGSVNNFTGSHVARIYKEGTTKKLHKYDGAFYSKLSMNINGDNGDDSGVLNIVSDNEGLNSELHLTINGGTINIQSQDDGINTNEDYISVTTINGGSLTINAGLGAEGDGIDSNGYLTINGGTVWSMSNPQTPDGGIDADCAITINGGTVYAFGTRNDAVDSASAQPYMELTFAATLSAGTEVKVTDSEGAVLWTATTKKACQSITLTTPELKLDTVYSVYVDGVLQCYNGNSSGMMGGFGGGQMPGGFGGQAPENMQIPEGFDPSQMGGGQQPDAMGGQAPENMQIPEGFDPTQMGGGQQPGGFGGQAPDGMQIPEGFDPSQMGGGQQPGGMGQMGGVAADGSGSTEFILTAQTKSFSGVCDSDVSGKTRVSFTVEGTSRSGRNTVIESVTAITPSADIDPSLVQVTVTDDPSEDYSASCLLSDGLDAVNALLPEDDGSYVLTVAVVSGAESYTGATQVSFTVGALPFHDVREDDEAYDSIKALYSAGIMNGTGDDTFSPTDSVTRAQAITVLARLAGAEACESDIFSDVASGSWYSGFVGWACENGIVLGDGEGHFMPNDTVTAEHMSLMIERYFKLIGSDDAFENSFSGNLNRGQLAQILAGLLK